MLGRKTEPDRQQAVIHNTTERERAMNNTTHPALKDMTTRERLLHAPDHNWRTVKEWAEMIGRGVTTTRQELNNLSFHFGGGLTDFERRGPMKGNAWEYRRRP